jgi:catecholate siderophore receptor
MTKPTSRLISSAVVALFALTLRAQTPLSSVDGDTVEMERFEVSDVPIEENIIPSSRPFSSVYGSDRSILETPRNVTIISREQLNAISIQDVRDFSKLTASSYTRSNFGAPSTPDIRTQIADLYQNGMRIGLSSNGNGLPINFNSVESVNIVKGPATAVYGASQYVGGYADLVTKRPSFDAAKGSASVTIGSYDVYRWTLDYNKPVSDKTAYRVSYSGEQSKGYYYDGKKNTQALYVALSRNGNERYHAFYNAELFHADYTENFGVNRPTQALIDTGMYQTGINQNPEPDFASYPFGYADASGNPITFSNINVVSGTPAPISDPQNSRWVVSGFPAVNNIALGPLVKLDRRSRLLKPGDDSEGVAFNAQSVQTFKPTPDVEIVNNTLFRYVNRNTLSRYMYSEIIDPSYSLESRSEFRFTTGPVFTNAGLSLRYQYVEAYNDFFSEPANVWDLTRDHSFIDYYNSINFPNPFTQVPVPGWQGRYYTPDNGDSGISKAWYVSPFFQSDWKINEAFSIVAGARVDLLSIDYHDPAGFLPGDHVTVGLPNYNVSAIYTFAPTASAYATYQWSQNPVGSTGNGGGLTTAGNANFSNANLRNEAELIEAGVKYGFLDGKGFVSFAAFRQVRADLQLDRSIVEFTTTGFELEANYQPSKRLYLTAGYSYLDSVVNAPQFDVGNTSLTSPLSRYFMLPTGTDLRRQGVPRNLFNALATYKFAQGFGASLGVVWTSDVANNVAATLVIPSQHTIDATVFYTTRRYDVRLAVLNATDEKNWSAPNAVYGNESIVAEPGIRGELTLKYKF